MSPFWVPTKSFFVASSCRMRTTLPDASRATAIVYVLPFAGGWSDVTSICLIASDFVAMWPVE